jgi:hypothetical protein
MSDDSSSKKDAEVSANDIEMMEEFGEDEVQDMDSKRYRADSPSMD